MTHALAMRALADCAAHRRDVETVIMACEDYSRLTVGAPPRREEVDDFFTALPPGCVPDDKFSLGFYEDDRIAGIADVVRGWNAPNKAIIGLLLFAPSFRGHGRGREAAARIEALALTWQGVDCLRLAVIDANLTALAFWRKMGFQENGERRPKEPPYIGERIVMEKTLLTAEQG